MKAPLSVWLWFISFCLQETDGEATEYIISYDRPFNTFVIVNTKRYTTERIKSSYPYTSLGAMVAEMIKDSLFLYCSTGESSSLWTMMKIRNYTNETELDLGDSNILGFDKHPKRGVFYFITRTGLLEYNSKLKRKKILLYETNLQHVKYDNSERNLYILRTAGRGTSILSYSLKEKRVRHSNGWIEYFKRFVIDFNDMVIYAPQTDGVYYSYLSVSMDFDNAIDLNALDKLCSAEGVGDLSLDDDYVYFVNNSNKIYRYILDLGSVELFMTVDKSEKLENILIFTYSTGESSVESLSAPSALNALPAMKREETVTIDDEMREIAVSEILIPTSKLPPGGTKGIEEILRELGETDAPTTEEPKRKAVDKDEKKKKNQESDADRKTGKMQPVVSSLSQNGGFAWLVVTQALLLLLYMSWMDN